MHSIFCHWYLDGCIWWSWSDHFHGMKALSERSYHLLNTSPTSCHHLRAAAKESCISHHQITIKIIAKINTNASWRHRVSLCSPKSINLGRSPSVCGFRLEIMICFCRVGPSTASNTSINPKEYPSLANTQKIYNPENYWKLTCPPKKDYFNRNYIFQPLIFRGHVNFQGSIISKRSETRTWSVQQNKSHVFFKAPTFATTFLDGCISETPSLENIIFWGFPPKKHPKG